MIFMRKTEMIIVYIAAGVNIGLVVVVVEVEVK